MNQLVIGGLLNGLIVFFAIRKKLLSVSGGLTALVVGMLFYLLGGFFSWFLLIIFFMSSGLIEKIKKKFHLIPKVAVVDEEPDGRTVVQVLANSLPALACLVLYTITGQVICFYAMVGTIAGATADTWSSQIGVLSKAPPLSILSFQPIATGLSGGVSRLGILASVGGGSFIALIFLAFNLNFLISQSHLGLSLLVIVGSGVVGSLIDSLLGATIQEKFILDDQSISEVVSFGKKRLYSGILGIDNNGINFLSGIFTAGFTMLSCYFWL